MRTIMVGLVTVLVASCATYEPHIPYASLFQNGDQQTTDAIPTAHNHNVEAFTDLPPVNVAVLNQLLQAGNPISIFAVPTSSRTVFKPVALATEKVVIPLRPERAIIRFPNDLSVWQRFGTASIPVQHAILLVEPRLPASTTPGSVIPNPALLGGILDHSVHHIHIDVNPEFADRLIWEGMGLTLWAVPVAGPLRLGTLMDALDVVGAVGAAGVTGGIKTGTGVLAGQLVEGHIGGQGITSHYAGDLVKHGVHRLLGAPQRPEPTYAFRVTDVSVGTLAQPGLSLMFNSHKVDTFRGLSLTDGWTSTSMTTVTQRLGPVYDIPTLHNPIAHHPLSLETLRPIEGGLSPDIARTLAPPVQWNRFSDVIGPATLSPDVSRTLLPDLNWTRSILQQHIRMHRLGY